MRRHSSFLLRYSDHDDPGAERIEIEHIQRRARTLVHSLAEAAEWISDQHRGRDRGEPNNHQTSGRTPT
ncbi:MAG: hypothetical protein WAS51_17540 [Ilumatobacteraceae bacterium]